MQLPSLKSSSILAAMAVSLSLGACGGFDGVELNGGVFDAVGIGFDFIEFLFRHWTPEQQAALSANMIEAHHVPGLTNHSHARNLTRQLLARGFHDDEIAKILYGNWLRTLKQVIG